MSQAQNIANTLTENELKYLSIADAIWQSGSWEDSQISDIEDTGGTFNPGENQLFFDYVDRGPFDSEHVQEVIRRWDSITEENDSISGVKLIDKILFEGAMPDHFQNVEIRVSKDTGSTDPVWQPRDNNAVEVFDIIKAWDPKTP